MKGKIHGLCAEAPLQMNHEIDFIIEMNWIYLSVIQIVSAAGGSERNVPLVSVLIKVISSIKHIYKRQPLRLVTKTFYLATMQLFE